MKIIESQQFKRELSSIAHIIKNDKPSASIQFVKGLKTSIKNLSDSPYIYRKSIYFNDVEIRDMIYYGYTIVYQVQIEKNLLQIMTIFNQNLPDIDCDEIFSEL